MVNGSHNQHNLPRVATIATMASRVATFAKVLPTIHAQVDRVYVYLDGYLEPPAFLNDFDRITVHHGEELRGLHCSSRFLCLQELERPAIVLCVDDDIAYPPNYVSVLADTLTRLGGNAIVGVHGRIFLPPHQSYVRHAMTLPFFAGLKAARHVHELGVGTCAFVSNRFPVDPRDWDMHNMDDIVVALEAQRLGLPRVAIPREVGWLRPYASNQPDSNWNQTRKDDAEHSRRMRILLALYVNDHHVARQTRKARAPLP